MTRGNAATVETGGKTTVGVVALGAAVKVVLAAATVGVVTPTTAVGVTAVVEAEEARLRLVVEPDAVRVVASEETTGGW